MDKTTRRYICINALCSAEVYTVITNDGYADKPICSACHQSLYEGKVDADKYMSRKRENAEDKTPLLTIKLENENSVPEVTYKGSEVKYKKNIQFDWDTSDAFDPAGLTYVIENYWSDGTLNKLERRKGFHR